MTARRERRRGSRPAAAVSAAADGRPAGLRPTIEDKEGFAHAFRQLFSACRRADASLWQAADLGDALLAFLIAAGAALLFTLPARTGLLYRFAAALATPLWLFAFVTECVSFYAFADGGRFFSRLSGF